MKNKFLLMLFKELASFFFFLTIPTRNVIKINKLDEFNEIEQRQEKKDMSTNLNQIKQRFFFNKTAENSSGEHLKNFQEIIFCFIQ